MQNIGYIVTNRNIPMSPPINPGNRKTVKRVLCIDTLYRKNYATTKSTDFVYVLPDPINNVIGLKVAAVEFPNAWYAFAEEDRSNEFTITVYNAPTPTDVEEGVVYPTKIEHVIQIPPGNYRSDLFSYTLNNIFTNIRNGLEYIYIDVNEVDSKMYFRTKEVGDDTRNIYLNMDLPPNFYFTLDFRIKDDPDRPLYKNAGWMMGFRLPFYKVDYRNPPVIVGKYSQYAVQIYNWYICGETSYGSAVENYVFLEIDDYNRNYTTNTFFSNTLDGYLGNNIVGRISVSSGMNTIVTNTAGDQIFKEREYFGPVKLEKMHIRLLNKYGEPILLNGNDFSFMLELDILYS